jgi:DNA polymerase elongation subunit (family B)
MMKREQPNIVTGYNIFGFDIKFLWECAEEFGCLKYLRKLGALKNQECVMETKELFSAALGHNFLYYFNSPGIVYIDLMKVIQKDHNLSSYKLDDVSTQFINSGITQFEHLEDSVKVYTKSTFSLKVGDYVAVFKQTIIGNEFVGEKRKILEMTENESFVLDGEGKNDFPENPKSFYWSVGKDNVSPQDIFDMQRGTDEDRSVVAKYCVQDCELCLNIMQKLEIITNNLGMSNVCLVPLSYLFMRGQMIKTLSLVSSECQKENYLIPELPRPKEDTKDSYEGAEVLEPTPAIFLNEPVSVLDYSSLYPSSMIGSNISHDSIIKEPKYQGEKGAKLLEEMGVKFEDVSYDNYINRLVGKTWKKSIVEEEPVVTCRFIQPTLLEDGTIDNNSRGILPRILMKLLKARKDTRNQIKTEKDAFRISVLDGLQLAYKVTANSLYGGVGAEVSSLYYKDIAASTTAIGRQHLHLAKDYVKEHFPTADIVYGDSVTGYTPITIKYKGQILIENIENVAKLFGEDKWRRCIEPGKQDKEACELHECFTWTSKGWTKLHRVIRHILVPEKKIIRVLTRTCCVDVTDDHSLILKSGEEISPKDLKLGDELLQRNIEFDEIIEYSNDEYVKKQIKYLKENMKSENESILSLNEIEYDGYVYDLTTDNHEFQAGIGNIIVHNTDSIFVNFKPKASGKEGIQESIDRSVEVEEGIQKLLAYPHKLEYEKTFAPFILLRKKGYIGNKYEFDLDKFKQTSMGVVTKRRDNAGIVKYVYDGIIKRIMNDRDIDSAIRFLLTTIDDILDGKFPLQYFIITKRLNAVYANPAAIVHKALADRMGDRDPGNKPQSNDRIPFVYIQTKEEPKLQGDRVEHPEYIIEHKLKVDYLFYITNQLSKPCCQVMGLALEHLRKYGYRLPTNHFDLIREKLERENKKSQSEIREKLMEERSKEAYNVLFKSRVKVEEGKKYGQTSITSFFKKK